jgi:hypothetical protein
LATGIAVLALGIAGVLVVFREDASSPSGSASQPSGRPEPGPESPREQGIQFLDVTRSAGILFTHSIGDGTLNNLVESTGSGAAFLDFDRDGFLDLYVSNMMYLEGVSKDEKPEVQPTGRLYHNRKDGTFEDVTVSSGLAKPYFTLGVEIGDYDSDGYPDIYLANYGPNRLFHNGGDGTFTDVTEQAGVGDDRCSVGAVFLDFDNDGRLDLYVVNYVQYDPGYKSRSRAEPFPGPLAYAGQPDALFRNRGDGTFEDVSEKAGISRAAGRGMGASAVDIDNDGDIDIYVANDAMANTFWINDGHGRFQDKALEMGVAYNHCGEGAASMVGLFGDYDGDGYLDLFVPDAGPKALYRNTGKGIFLDATATSGVAGLSGQYVTWAAGFCDFDNDQDLDLYYVNGPLLLLSGQRDLFLENVGQGKFRDSSMESGEYFKTRMCGRGGCFGDYDNDGDIDVFVVNLNDRPVLLQNAGGNRRHFLQVLLEGTKSNRDAVGAVVEIRSGGKKQVGQRFNGGYLSSSDPRLHFGLGTNEAADEVRVRWPSGVETLLTDVPANQVLNLREPAGTEGK